MKPSDFFIGSRQFFGFVAPGALWISGWMLLEKKSPVDYLGGDGWVTRLILFLGLSYVVGYVLQTLLFWPYLILDDKGSLWPWSQCWKDHSVEGADPPWLKDDKRLQRDVKTVLPFLQKDLDLDPDGDIPTNRVPKFCRNIALEYCTYARYRIIEFESEINFTVALSFALPWLALGWVVYDRESWPPRLVLITALVIGITLLRRVPKMRRNEKAMWCEKYVILRARAHLGST